MLPENSYALGDLASSVVNSNANYDIDRYISELMNRGIGRNVVARAGLLFLLLGIMTVVIHCWTHFPVGLLFTYIDNAHFLLHGRSKLHLFPCKSTAVVLIVAKD